MSQLKADILSQIILEANAYRQFDDIEKLSDSLNDLSVIPIQPLYLSLKNTSLDQIAEILPKLSRKQRLALLDLDTWNKDEIDIHNYDQWPKIYAKCTDLTIVQEFACSQEFFLYLKSRVNIYQFDIEDPSYPDHDNFFLTDDDLYLIEYNENFDNDKELKYILKNLYAAKGVDQAALILQSLVNDTFSSLQEEVYNEKKERLRDYGFVDYFEALYMRNTFSNNQLIEHFIKEKKTLTPSLDKVHKMQSLHAQSITPYSQGLEEMHLELQKLNSDKRADYLHFNFLRLVNGTLALDDGLKAGSLAIARSGKETKILTRLGFLYVKSHLDKDENVFNKFDFIDLYRIGYSLVTIERSRLKKVLENYDESQESFIGEYFSNLIHRTFESVGSHAGIRIDSLSDFVLWQQQIEQLVQIMPFIKAFYQTFIKLKEESVLNDQFYLNYSVEHINFESLIISSFINSYLGYFNQADHKNKLGVQLDDLKKFLNAFFKISDSKTTLVTSHELTKEIQSFNTRYGFNSVKNADQFLEAILKQHLEGYPLLEMSLEDFKHMGGPIIYIESKLD